ncbi:hypothetical protein, partial [Thalassobacillus sp. C254]|uniref:hypothetical protein n=1 Tax=Thalassobacillus sp. C254 TaxID=1225341 RepID=UPI0022B73CDB
MKIWETHYQETYYAFINNLEKRNLSVQEWVKEVEEYNSEEITWFTNLYPLLTSGAEFIPDYKEDFLEQLVKYSESAE